MILTIGCIAYAAGALLTAFVLGCVEAAPSQRNVHEKDADIMAIASMMIVAALWPLFISTVIGYNVEMPKPELVPDRADGQLDLKV